MSDTPDSLLDVALMRRLAGEKLFAHGEAYYADGRVRQLQTATDRATGRVEGTRAYRVKLWKAGGNSGFPAPARRVRTSFSASIAWRSVSRGWRFWAGRRTGRRDGIRFVKGRALGRRRGRPPKTC